MSVQEKLSGRTRQPKSVRESDILAAAHEIFSVKGYEKAAMSEIAKGAGVAEGTIYKHFSNKQDLLAGVFSGFYKTLIENTQSSLLGIKGIENQLRVLITRHINTFFEDTGLCRLLLQEVRPLNNYPHSQMHQLTRQYSEILLKVIEEGITNREIIASVSAKTVRDMVFGSLEHAGWNVLNSQKAHFDAEQLTEDIITIILKGLMILEKVPLERAILDKVPDKFENNLTRLEQLIDRLENNKNP